MAITDVPTEPQNYRAVYNAIEYVAESDDTTETRFKYLFDIYDGATLLGRLKVPADPNDYGRCNINGIAESYISTDLGTIGGTTGFTGNANSWKEFTVQIGEEFDILGVLTPDPNQETKTVIKQITTFKIILLMPILESFKLICLKVYALLLMIHRK